MLRKWTYSFCFAVILAAAGCVKAQKTADSPLLYIESAEISNGGLLVRYRLVNSGARPLYFYPYGASSFSGVEKGQALVVLNDDAALDASLFASFSLPEEYEVLQPQEIYEGWFEEAFYAHEAAYVEAESWQKELASYLQRYKGINTLVLQAAVSRHQPEARQNLQSYLAYMEKKAFTVKASGTLKNSLNFDLLAP